MPLRDKKQIRLELARDTNEPAEIARYAGEVQIGKFTFPLMSTLSDAVIKNELDAVDGYQRERTASMALPDEDSDEAVPYTGKRRNGENYLDVVEYFKRSDLGEVPENLRSAMLVIEQEIMREERAEYYRELTPQQYQDMNETQVSRPPFIGTANDMRTAGGYDAETLYESDDIFAGDE